MRMVHRFQPYDEYYEGYGIVARPDGTFCATNDTPQLHDKVDFPNVGYGHYTDQSVIFDSREKLFCHIDSLVAMRKQRIGWVKEFSLTQKNPDWTEHYLLSSCDPRNDYGHLHRSHHTEAENYAIWGDGTGYVMRWGMGAVRTSKTKYLYQQFLIKNGYIEKLN